MADISCLLAEKYQIDINQELLREIGLTHDLGKADPKFQRYLAGLGPGVNHSQRSAWFTYSLNEDIWATEAVCRHHTHLFGVGELDSKWFPDDSNVSWETISKDMKKLIPNWPFSLSLTKKQFDNFECEIFSIEDDIKKKEHEDDWFKLRTLYSLFITADRMDALDVSKEDIMSENFEIQWNSNFNRNGKDVSKNPINIWRTEIQKLCYNQAQKITGPGIYTLTLPTGAGKTIAGLEIAHLLSKRFGASGIIYALPFISIVEQTSDISKKGFGEQSVQEDHSLMSVEEESEESEFDWLNSGGFEPSSADMTVLSAGSIPYKNQWAKMANMFRYWQKPVIITTLAHLWQVLFSSKSNRTMNFHRLSKAVVIIDEPQGISPDFWVEIGDMFNYLCNHFQTFFILMTATQPFLPAVSVKNELAPPNTFFPKNRHTYHYFSEKYDLEELMSLLEEKNIPFEESGAIVLNTKDSAQKVYHQFVSYLNSVFDFVPEDEIYFLSGWLTPKSKRNVLNKLKKAEENGKRRYLVTTQVIEAGVDLDFSWIFRDFAPLDSLIQVAGRCNRHALREGGHVIIAELHAKNNRGYCNYVYNNVLLDSTRKFLKEKFPAGSFNECDINTSVSEYYRELIENRKITPKELLTALRRGDWDNLPSLFEDDKYIQATLYIEEDEGFMPILNKLQETEWNLENRAEQKKLFSKLQQYSISVPLYKLKECLDSLPRLEFSGSREPLYPIFGNEMNWVLTHEAIDVPRGFYDRKLGFTPPVKSTEDFIF